jgi:non-heme chloroperoxidase
MAPSKPNPQEIPMLDSRSLDAMPNFIRTSDNVALFYRDWGAGKPLLFLHGWALNSQMWAYQMLPLSSQGFRCIAYDRRAHGRSSDPGRGFDYDTLADDLAAILEALDLSDVTLIAHSFASGETVRYLTRHGDDRIARLLLVSPAAIPYLTKTADNPIGIDPAMIEQLRAPILRDFPGWCEAGAEAYFAGSAKRAVADWTIRTMTEASMLAVAALNRTQFATDFRPELPRIAVPTLIVHGDCDASAPLDLTGRPAAAQIPGARLEVYEGGPHGLYFTHQERLVADIARFATADAATARQG